jgi:hypothetical protein
MRSRKEIQKDYAEFCLRKDKGEIELTEVLEVLLDIRDILKEAQKNNTL